MKTAVWNFEFAPPRGKAIPELRRRVTAVQPDVCILSEVRMDAVPAGHAIFAHSDWGYASHARARKISLISAHPWRETVQHTGGRPLQGRFVSGVTRVGPIDCVVIGICIPWSFCHVSSGQRDQARWDEHKAFIRALPDALDPITQSGLPVLLGGDFNHTFPRVKSDAEAHQMIVELLEDRDFKLATDAAPFEGRLLNHLAVRGLRCGDLLKLDNMSDGRQLTDHIGVAAELTPVA